MSVPMSDERVHVDPCISVGDLEWVFIEWFALFGRDVQRLLDMFAQETWKTAPKALWGISFNPWGVFSITLLPEP